MSKTLKLNVLAPLLLTLVIALSPVAVRADTQEVVSVGTATIDPTSRVVKLVWNADFSGAKQILLHVKGSSQDDVYLRLLVVILGTSVLDAKTWSGGFRWSGVPTGTEDKYSAFVSGSFDLKWDVTNLIKDKSSGEVYIGISTGSGKWDVTVEFIVVKSDVLVIPDNPVTGQVAVPVATASAGIGVLLLALAWWLKSRA